MTERDYPTLEVEVDGESYVVDLGDCTALDATECRKATGLSLRGLLEAADRDPDIDHVAAAMWLARRQNGEPNLSYQRVAADLAYDADIVYDTGQDDDEDDAGDAPGEGQDGS